MIEGSAKSGTPDDRVNMGFGILWPDDTCSREAHKRAYATVEHTTRSRLAYRWYHHNIA
jgi:hypothetical protein